VVGVGEAKAVDVGKARAVDVGEATRRAVVGER